MAQNINTEKENVKQWLQLFASAARESKNKAMAKRLHQALAIPSRSRKASVVSIYRLNNVTKEGDNVIIPRKVVSSGKMDHKINVAALEYSKGALTALQLSGSKIMDAAEMLNQKRVQLIV